MPRHSKRIARVLLVSALVTTGCAEGNSGGSVGPAVVPNSRELKASKDPIGEEWRLSQPWASPTMYNKVAYELRQRAIAVCMANIGFRYVPFAFADTDLEYRLMNPLNRSVASTWGYHDPVMPPPRDGNSDQGPDFVAALTQRPGCVNAADSFVFGGKAQGEYSTAQAGLLAQVDQLIVGVDHSDEVAALVRDWASCMSTHGYSYYSPAEVSRRFSSRPTVSEEELSVRSTDMGCDESVGLTHGRSSRQTAAIARWLDEHALQVSEVESLLRTASLELNRLSEQLEQAGASALPVAPEISSPNESVPPTTL